MSNQQDTLPNMEAVLRHALGDALAPDAAGFLELCAEDVVLEFPFAQPDAPTRVVGQDDLAAYLQRLDEVVELKSMSYPVVHRAVEAGTFVIEFSAKAISRVNGKHLTQKYIVVVRTSGGRITSYRDYWNPLVGIAATETADV